ncbi:MAG: ATP-dependent RNA helicase HrpA, partial [Pseudomonadota bacterium]
FDADALMLRDRPALARAQRERPSAKKAASLARRFEASQASVLRRADLALDTTLVPDLPITAKAEDIAKAMADHQVVVVCGATGSGKTTQLPKLCLAAGRGVFGSIGHTQPRRLAARAVAERVAEETGTRLGEGVGYQVRFADEVGPDSRVVVMTDGILLQQLKRDPNLLRYDTLILDEAHERSLNIDFLLGVIKRLLKRRPELRLIVTSATIDPGRFSRYFDDAPVIEVGGRSYPIEMRYAGDDGQPLPQRVTRAVQSLLGDGGEGDMLVFLPGERDIREADRALRGAGLSRQLDVLPLYARLSTARQLKVFQPGPKRRVVLSTNVAETSLTVPRIRFVIDSGLARIGRYSHRSKMQRLPIEPVAVAGLDQRAGRCGRLGPGICVRLFDADDLEQRPAFEAPQIQRSNLAGVILQMAHLGLGRIEDFDFMDPPEDSLVRDGYTLLRELGALDEDDGITSVGRGMAGLPLEPRLSRALLAAQRFNCLTEALVVVSALAVADPLERRDAEPAAFVDKRSDWSTRLNLWRALAEQGGASRQKAWCKDNGVHWVRVLEWRDVHRQLKSVCRERRLTLNEKPANAASLHRALLAGFVSHIGQRDEGRRYRGARGRQFSIFPGSPVAASPPPWIVATELIETSRVFGHQLAAVTPAWIVEAAGHLVRREPVAPMWSGGAGRATAKVRAVVFGLAVELPKRVPLAPMDPAGARALAIEHLLVQPPGEGPVAKLPFTRHNRQRLHEARQMEDRARRLLVDDAALFRFFDARVPRKVVDQRALLEWHKTLSADDARALELDWSDLGLDGPLSLSAFPTRFKVGRNALTLTYRFAPGERDDGATLRVPEALTDQMDAGALQWLVPGWLDEKVNRLLRGLPKAQRKRLAPIQDASRAFLAGAGLDDGMPEVSLHE